MKESLPPTVCLDGASVRRIREEKKLTQLYVAKVVGVTTDTISRWENNRYPSIKRENALRLAEAIEVPVEQILKPDEAEPAAQPVVVRRRWYPFVPPVLVVLVLAGIYLFLHRGAPPEAGVVGVRLLPPYAAPGSVIPVQVRLEMESEAKGVILREYFPPGWKLIEADPPASSLDNVEGVARWIIKPGEGVAPISYRVQVADDAELGSQGAFRGEVVAKSSGRIPPAVVEGVQQVEVAPFLWADLNGDSIIDDSEMLQASDTVDAMDGVHLDWTLLEKIWDAGGYRWDAVKEGFVPARPAHGDAPP